MNAPNCVPTPEPHLRQLSPSCNPTPIFRDITTITSGFDVVTAGPEHHILIADNPIMATVVFPPLRHHYRYMKTSKEGLLPGLAHPRSLEVACGRSNPYPDLPPPSPEHFRQSVSDHIAALPPLRLLGGTTRHDLLGAMALPGDSHQDTDVGASDPLSSDAPDRNHVRGSYSNDRMVCHVAVLAVGVYTGHAVHHRRGGGIHDRILFP